MLQTIEAFVETFDLGFQQVAEIIEASVHRVAEVVDAPVLKIYPEQVAANDDGDWPPLANDGIHRTSVPRSVLRIPDNRSGGPQREFAVDRRNIGNFANGMPAVA
jgi:hypothetical protein